MERFFFRLCSAHTILWVLLSGLVTMVTSFNIDVASPLIFRNGEQGSMFGQSLTLHQHGSETMLVVGAPKAQGNRSEIVHGGVAFKCSFTNSNTSLAGNCTEIPLDTRGNDFSASTGKQISNKSDQYLGAVMGSGGPNGSLVICRPRYQYYFYTKNGDQKRELLGGCFVITQEDPDFSHPNILIPCISGGDKRCHFGFSVSVHQDRILFGAVGMGRHEGQFWTSDQVGENRQKRPTKRGVQEEDSYMGYAVASADWKDDSRPEYAISIPRHRGAFGKVVLYDSDLVEYNSLENGDMGSYFGHTLVAADFNNDGWDDLLVGAPLFTDSFSTNGTSWEVGKVFIYYNNKEGGFGAADIITGSDTGGRLGYAAASLGDVNVDGYNDLAIAAPYVNSGKSGKIFIYHGIGRNVRIPLVPVQTLQASQFGQKLQPFGCSLSAGIDVDGNNYPDLAVGAYKSQVAVVYRSRPSFTASIQVFHRSRLINLDSHDYHLEDGTVTTALNLSACLSFSGHGLPTTIAMDYTITLDVGQTLFPRVVFAESKSATLHTTTIANTKKLRHCVQHTAYIKPSIYDKQTPVSVVATYSYPEAAQTLRTPAGYLVPVLSRWAVTRTVFSIPFKRNCANSTCFPNLVVSARSSTPSLIAGGNGHAYISVNVENRGEDSFYSKLDIAVPEEMYFSRLDRSITDTTIGCSVISGRVSCNIGNPIKAGGKIEMGIIFKTERLASTKSHLDFSMKARSGDDEMSSSSHDNQANVSIPIISSANITLRGRVNPEMVIFKEVDYPIGREVAHVTDVGPRVTHTISLVNAGPSFVGTTEVTIAWPTFPVDGSQLLYPVDVTMSNGGECFLMGGMWNAANLSMISNRRRRAEDKPSRWDFFAPTPTPLPQELTTMSCSDFLPSCEKILCYVDSLGAGFHSADDVVAITVTSHLRTDLLMNYNVTNLNFITSVEASVTSSFNRNHPFKVFPSTNLEMSTLILTKLRPPRLKIPYLIYGLAIAGGLIIQLMLISILNKVGFFKRKKISPKQNEKYVDKECGQTNVTEMEANPLRKNDNEGS